MENPLKFQYCSNHPGRLLASSIEFAESLCMACISVRLKRIAELEAKLHDEIVENDLVKNQNKDISSQIEKLTNLMKAEMMGNMAAQRSIAEDQNPFPAGEMEHAMWLNGWQSAEMFRRTEQALAVIKWSSETLMIIEELVKVCGHEEAAGKISTVRSKLDEFLENEER